LFIEHREHDQSSDISFRTFETGLPSHQGDKLFATMFATLKAWLFSNRVLAVSGLSGGMAVVAATVALLWPSLQLWALVAVIVVAILLLVGDVAETLDKGFRQASPYILTVLLVVLLLAIYQTHGTLLSIVENVNQSVSFAIANADQDGRPGIGGLFNSWSSAYSEREGYTHVFTSGHQGNGWLINQAEESASFSYVRHTDQTRHPSSSSGAFLTFYAHPLSRLKYRYLTFWSKISDAEGAPDFGIRLVLDDPDAGEVDKEVVTYELPSARLLGTLPINANWQRFHVYVWQLDQLPAKRACPPKLRIEQNSVNKIVFFVTNEMADRSPKATLWFRDIIFSTEAR
jgi:NADH:ubiquinone oxidoreductase subunit 6 (subunit J)